MILKKVTNMLIYGQPSSGKTTMGEHLCNNFPKTMLIDGDMLRTASTNVAYDRAGRLKNIDNAIMVAKIANANNLNVVISLVAPYQEMRDKIRMQLPGISIVYLKYDRKHVHRPRQEYFVADFEEGNDYDIMVDTGKIKEAHTWHSISGLWVRNHEVDLSWPSVHTSKSE